MMVACTPCLVCQSVWQSLFERNERLKLQRENADMGANAQRNQEEAKRNQEEAKRLRARLGEERRKVQDAESNARCVLYRCTLFTYFSKCIACDMCFGYCVYMCFGYSSIYIYIGYDMYQ